MRALLLLLLLCWPNCSLFAALTAVDVIPCCVQAAWAQSAGGLAKPINFKDCRTLQDLLKRHS